jgi:hypothetical protein
MAYRSIDRKELVATLERLRDRIEARFPGADLAKVADETVRLAAETGALADRLAAPAWGLRALITAVLAGGVALLYLLVRDLEFQPSGNNLFNLIQSVDALVNVILIGGAAVLSLVTIERRVRRNRALAALRPFRAIVHVIDMHQLTKDPGAIGRSARPTHASPKRSLDAFETSRYLDYCSELLSLTAKAAALHALATDDTAIVTAVNEIEQLTSNLSQKIWQKIMILHADSRLVDAEPGATPAPPAAAGLPDPHPVEPGGSFRRADAPRAPVSD